MTTRRPAILEDMGPSQIRRIDLDLPSTAEALDLLEAVSGSEVTYTSGATALVQLCGNLPLAVSSVAILIRGSRVSAPMPAAAVVDLLSHGFLTLNDVGSTANPHNDSFRTFDRSFCIFGQIARSLRTCFASYCCCFATEHEIRPLVPRGAVECLFDAILSGHGGYLDKGDRMLLSVQDDDQPFASAEIIDKLVSIGLVDVITAEGYTSPEGSDLCIHHDLQYDFGVQTAVALERLLWKSKARHATTEQLKKYAMIRANDVLLRGYKDDRAASPGPSHTRSLDSDWDVIVGEHRLYMLKHLFRHVMRANKKAKARKLTSSSMFIGARVQAFGMLDTMLMLKGEIGMIHTPHVMGWRPPPMIEALRRFDQEFAKRYIALVGDPRASKRSFLEYFVGRINFLATHISWFLNFGVTLLRSRSALFVLVRKQTAKVWRKNIMQCIAAGYKDDDPYILYGREGVRKYMRAMHYIYIYVCVTHRLPCAFSLDLHYSVTRSNHTNLYSYSTVQLEQDFDGALAVSDQFHQKMREITEDAREAREALVRRTERPYICLCARNYDEGVAYLEEDLRRAELLYDARNSAIASYKYIYAETLWRKMKGEKAFSLEDKGRAAGLYQEAREAFDRLGWRAEVGAIDKRIASLRRSSFNWLLTHNRGLSLQQREVGSDSSRHLVGESRTSYYVRRPDQSP